MNNGNLAGKAVRPHSLRHLYNIVPPFWAEALAWKGRESTARVNGGGNTTQTMNHIMYTVGNSTSSRKCTSGKSHVTEKPMYKMHLFITRSVCKARHICTIRVSINDAGSSLDVQNEKAVGM